MVGEMLSNLLCLVWSDWPHVAVEHLECGYCDLGVDFQIVFNFSEFKFK